MSSQGYWKEITISTTFMFVPKTNLKKKRVKKTQKHETVYAVTKTSLEYFHHNSKTQNHFQVKPKPLES
jgi:hypothetical protein